VTEFEERKRIEMEYNRQKNEKRLAEAQLLKYGPQSEKKRISKRA